MKQQRILVVDDEDTQRETLAGYLQKQGFRILQAGDGTRGLALLQEQAVDAVISDIRMPGMDGLEFLRRVKALNPEVSVILMTAFGSVEDAVTAMKQGAEDYLQKPLDLDQVDIVIHRVLENRLLRTENRRLKEALRSRYQFAGIVSASASMERAVNLAARTADSRATVLIRGESGTGKEVLARTIHLAGARKDAPFVPLNVAALPESLVESELFGHEKGAFTGADRQRPGRLEQADGGTLFIDEIGDIPQAGQVKLLRVLQERCFQRIGGTETLSVDVRILAATHQDLEGLIKAGRFREDLFFRINVISIRIPPLRERREDIPHLADHFLRKYAGEEGKDIRSLSREALDVLMKYDYPGNVRELENLIQRAVVLCRGDLITVEDLSLPRKESRMKEGEARTLADRVAHLEKKLIMEALGKSGGNQSGAARALGLTERNLRYKMKKYGMK
jgi:two-component system NtrC family response regulator